METKSKVGLLVLGAASVAVVGLIVYSNFGRGKLRPAMPDEVAKHLQGEWSGVSVDSYKTPSDIFNIYGGLQGNRFEGKERAPGSPCPKRVIAGSVEENRISEEITYTDVPDGAPSFCRQKLHTKYEMKIGEDGAPYLIGSWEVEGWSGTVEFTKVR